MLPDLLSTLLALALVCSAVLDQAMLETHGAILAVCGIAMAALGIWANRVDYLKLAGMTVIVAGAAILLLFVSRLSAVSPETFFWVVFWSGNLAGLVLLWSALYRGPREATDSPSG